MTFNNFFHAIGVNAEALLEEERVRMRSQYEEEMQELRQKMEKEKQTKAKMQQEVEIMKNQYEEKLRTLETRARTASLSRQHSVDGPLPVAKSGKVNEVQHAAMVKLKQLQEEMIDGGKRAGDKDLKERRKRKKKAAENRIKVLGEALGHVDDEDGVLLKVYDDIQEELRVKTEALKKSKQRVSLKNDHFMKCALFFKNKMNQSAATQILPHILVEIVTYL